MFVQRKFPQQASPELEGINFYTQELARDWNIQATENWPDHSAQTCSDTSIWGDGVGSCDRSAQELHVSKDSVWKVLKEQLLHLYHRLRVQAMGPTDYEPRDQICQWMIQHCIAILHFKQFVLFSDEASYSREGLSTAAIAMSVEMQIHVLPSWIVTNNDSRSTCGQELFKTNY